MRQARLPSDIAMLATTSARRFPTGTVWAVTCGSALALAGVDHRPSDLDIFAPAGDAQCLWDSLQGLPQAFPYHAHAENGITSKWGRYQVGGIELDIVGDFTVRRLGHVFRWDARHPCWDHLDTCDIAGVPIPHFRLEDLLLLYVALPNEEQKLARIIAEFRATCIDREYLALLTGGDPALDHYIGEVFRTAG
jgi:hypothetical protein